MVLKIVDRFRSITSSIVGKKSRQPYWIEITTKKPECLYYFGPFDSYGEAKEMQGGYIEDLIEERASGITVKIKRCLPLRLTITPEELPA